MFWRLSFQTLLAGLILGLGVGLTVGIGFGAGPHDAFVVGLTNLIGASWLSVGTVTFVVSFLYLVAAHRLGFRITLQIPIAIVSLSAGVDLGVALTQPDGSWFYVGSIFVVSLMIKAAAISYLMESRAGGSSLEALFLAVSRRSGASEFKVRLIAEITFLVAALALLGPVDWGTAVGAVVFPVMVNGFQKWAFRSGADKLMIIRVEEDVTRPALALRSLLVKR